jgi:hypothetical protein
MPETRTLMMYKQTNHCIVREQNRTEYRHSLCAETKNCLMLKLLVYTVTIGILKHYWPPDHKKTRDSGDITPRTLNLGTITESPSRGTHWIQQIARQCRGKKKVMLYRHSTIHLHGVYWYNFRFLVSGQVAKRVNRRGLYITDNIQIFSPTMGIEYRFHCSPVRSPVGISTPLPRIWYAIYTDDGDN